MLLKLYSIITGVSLVCGCKVSHDLLKDKEYVEQIKKTELGRKILNTFKNKLVILLIEKKNTKHNNNFNVL